MIIGVVLKPKKETDMSQAKRLLELVVHTPILEELKKVVKVAKEIGYPVPDIDFDLIYQDDKENTCVFISKDKFSIMAKSWYESSGFKIISFETFMYNYPCIPIQKQAKNAPELIINASNESASWFKEMQERIKSCTEQIEDIEKAGAELAHKLINSLSHFSKVQYEKKIKDLEQKLANEIKDRTQLQKDFDDIVNECERLENLPKVGDVCLFWSDDSDYALLGKLRDNGSVYGLPKFENCIKATPENIQAKINELFND